MDLPDLPAEAWTWLLAFGLLSALALLAIAAQSALQHASRPRLRLLAEGRVKRATSALKMLEDDSPIPTLLLFLLIVGVGRRRGQPAGRRHQRRAAPPLGDVADCAGSRWRHGHPGRPDARRRSRTS